MAEKPVTEAAERLRFALKEAKDNNHYTNGWYAHVDRQDVEVLVAYVLAVSETAEPTPALAPRAGQLRVTVYDEKGREHLAHVVDGRIVAPITTFEPVTADALEHSSPPSLPETAKRTPRCWLPIFINPGTGSEAPVQCTRPRDHEGDCHPEETS